MSDGPFFSCNLELIWGMFTTGHAVHVKFDFFYKFWLCWYSFNRVAMTERAVYILLHEYNWCYFNPCIKSTLYIYFVQVELACLKFPYSRWTTPFDQLKAVVEEPSPKLPQDFAYSQDFHDFVALWYAIKFCF